MTMTTTAGAVGVGADDAAEEEAERALCCRTGELN
jgi:hypothetical protein